MKRTSRCVVGWLVAALLYAVPNVFAAPPFPLVQAASSSNNDYMVLVEYGYDRPNAEVRTITQFTYRIVKREEFASFPGMFKSPAAYWSEAWVLSKPQDHGPSLPLISGNGRYLVLLALDAPSSESMEVLRIYRQEDGKRRGELVGTCKLNDFWPSDQLPKRPVIAIGRTPRWFEDGSFAFSSGDTQLIHTTRWGNTVRIDLKGGNGSTQCPVTR